MPALNQGSPLNRCTHIANGKIRKVNDTVDGSTKQGGAVLVGEGGVGVGGKQSVKVWDNFECAAGARLCL